MSGLDGLGWPNPEDEPDTEACSAEITVRKSDLEKVCEVPRMVRLRCPKCGKSDECSLDKDDPLWSHEETAEIRTSCFSCLGGERKPMTYHREDGSEICKPNRQLADKEA